MDKTRGSLHNWAMCQPVGFSHLRLKPLLDLPAPPTGAALYLQSTGQGRPAAPEPQDHQLDLVFEQPQQRLGNMVPTQRKSQLCLLLLGLLGMTILVHAPPPGISPADWFIIQHINMTNDICNIAMRAINRYNFFQGICKGQNTFLNTTTLLAVTNLCHTPNITCIRRGRNCHRSLAAVNVTYCNSTGRARTYLQCQYQQYFVLKNYSIACDNTNVPVHFDRLY